MRQLTVQTVMTTWAQPVRRVLAIAAWRPQIEFDRQFQMVHALLIAQENIQLAQGVATGADWQIGSQQLDPWRLLQGKLPETFVVQT
ncbi:hypothetical protein D3C72_1711580 [compost metagenome]